ncbi:MAG TPA: sigma-54-dependent Fis family transcriptional regulator [Clostridiales bacterium]|nr:sigma-54-dependent Fis family transcriptional regulator [Clostridiales bacterium]
MNARKREPIGRLEREYLLAVLNAVDEAIHIVDDKGFTVFYNDKAARYERLEAQEIVGKHILQVYPSLRPGDSTLLEVLRTGRPVLNRQQTFTTEKGHTVTVLASTFPVYRGAEFIGAVDISRDITEVRDLLDKILVLQNRFTRLTRSGRPADAVLTARYTFGDLIGEDPRLRAVKALAARAAGTTAPVFLFGETGTGKELLAQSIHNASLRRDRSFIAQNCAAIPADLLESILFGSVRGAFTGAHDRPGLFEAADGGTLFLDELTSLPIALQAKLLRALEDGYLRRVGGIKPVPVDVRILASGNLEPTRAVHEGKLRQDLFARLSSVCLELPPLRERRGDIPGLVEHFLLKHGGEVGSCTRLAPEVESLFARYDWPGNVRELEGAIQGGLVLALGEACLRGQHLPAHIGRLTETSDTCSPAESGGTLRERLEDHERSLIRAALARAGGNVSQAARILGLPRQTLQYRMRSLGERES